MKILFLDIDGVLQPGGAQNRFKNDLDLLKSQKIIENPEFESVDKYDLGAVFYDWAIDSVELIRKLLDNSQAKIVISSSWRNGKTLNDLKLLFSIHKLNDYVIGATPIFSGSNRGEEIASYLTENLDVEKFVIVDDIAYTLDDRFPDNFVYCEYKFTQENYRTAISILN
jgi:hypothetical protein